MSLSGSVMDFRKKILDLSNTRIDTFDANSSKKRKRPQKVTSFSALQKLH